MAHRALPAPTFALGKLAPPRLGRVFARQRLFAVLDALAAPPGLWLAGAPGAGKSTLIATWLQARARTALWLQLDAADADPATLVGFVDALVATAAGRDVAWPEFRADDRADLAGSLRRRVRLYLAQLPPPWTLVLDNAQELPADAPLQAALAQALSELPPGVQWVFVSREPAPPAFARALLQQQLAPVDADALRFDDDEALQLTRLHGRPDAMAPALAVAQGWAGGMTLMLAGAAGTAALPGVAARERLFEYFAEEVLARMSAREQRTLCLLAHLPAASAELAVALSGDADAPALLERMAGCSLFTDRREAPSGDVGYVFHALFSEFLRRRLQRLQPADACRDVQRRAAALLVDGGQVDAGLQRLGEAGCWDDAEAVLRRAAPGYVGSGRTEALRRHIDRLPEAQRAGLRYWRGLCALDAEPAAALADLQAVAREREAAGDADGLLDAVAAQAVALVMLGRLRELDGCIELLDRHAGRAAIVRDEADDLRRVPGLLAALVYRAPWHPLAEPLAARAERLLHWEFAAGQRLLLGSLAFHLLWRGHGDRLERIVQRIDALCAPAQAAPATLLRWWSVGVLVKTLLGQHASAEADAARALALVQAEPALAAQRTGAELQMMIVAIACTDAARARQHLERAAEALHPDQAVERATLEHQRGILAMLERDWPTALRLMGAAVASARAGGFPLREHIALIAHALAAACSDEHAAAGRLLDEVFAHPFHADCRWHHWIAGLVAAYAAQRRGDEPAALRHLCVALGAAAAHGFRHGPMLFACSDMMARLMALALAHDIEPAVARDVVGRNALKAPPQADARWPWPLRVHALGGWRVELDGRAPEAGRKDSRKLPELLRLLVAHGDAPLPLDEAADVLWPDADGDAARNSLDNALHRLRKWLGGDERLLLRDGALALNRDACWSDVAQLERLLGRLDGLPAPALPQALAALQALYRGPLLPLDERPAIAARRTALQRRVRRAAQQALERAAGAGFGDAARQAAGSLPDL